VRNNGKEEIGIHKAKMERGRRVV